MNACMSRSDLQGNQPVHYWLQGLQTTKTTPRDPDKSSRLQVMLRSPCGITGAEAA